MDKERPILNRQHVRTTAKEASSFLEFKLRLTVKTTYSICRQTRLNLLIRMIHGIINMRGQLMFYEDRIEYVLHVHA